MSVASIRMRAASRIGLFRCSHVAAAADPSLWAAAISRRDAVTHLLWLDADQSQQTNLYAALLAPDLSVERGPVSVSEGLALDYSAVPDGSGGLWTVWSGGQFSEMTLYLRRIDARGTPAYSIRSCWPPTPASRAGAQCRRAGLAVLAGERSVDAPAPRPARSNGAGAHRRRQSCAG